MTSGKGHPYNSEGIIKILMTKYSISKEEAWQRIVAAFGPK